ncbi:S-layer family protein [Paenibacillus taihuensis]|uniref:S-layer family protein n=1 Tax=Paenibacillus taihuensis TaxID=1156355 RepID=A0A3D9SNY7_9BACL|nr:S-layer homology domain-containing protein [Paenibacillus taihuensis]REE94655.1 S-layer family protein [Paenibacillus taihuensis]
MKKLVAVLSTAVLISSASVSTAFAFSDVDKSQSTVVATLQQKGIVNGTDPGHFNPKGTVNFAQGVQLIVNTFGYNLDLMRFLKLPKASDFYTNVPDNAWYADAFVRAHFNGVDIPKDVNPNAVMTREQFASMLDSALSKKADLPMVKLYLAVKDGDQISTELQGSVERLVYYKIVALDKDGKFNPKGALNRGEASTWIYNAINVMNQVKDPVQSENVQLSVEKVNDDVNKVTVSRGEKPNAGYAIAIDSISFGQDGRAVIHYTLQDPKPDPMYADMITVPTAVTYISSKYEAVLEPAAVDSPELRHSHPMIPAQ